MKTSSPNYDACIRSLDSAYYGLVSASYELPDVVLVPSNDDLFLPDRLYGGRFSLHVSSGNRKRNPIGTCQLGFHDFGLQGGKLAWFEYVYRDASNDSRLKRSGLAAYVAAAGYTAERGYRFCSGNPVSEYAKRTWERLIGAGVASVVEEFEATLLAGRTTRSRKGEWPISTQYRGDVHFLMPQELV